MNGEEETHDDMELIQWKNTAEVLKQYAMDAETLYRERLRNNGRVASGELLNSVHTHLVMSGTTIAVDMDLAAYWKYIEWDVPQHHPISPNYPPFSAIFGWVKAKKLLPRDNKAGKVRVRGKNKGVPFTEEDMQRGLAWAIKKNKQARGKDGVDRHGTHELDDTIHELNAQYEERLTAAIAADLGEATDAILRVFAR